MNEIQNRYEASGRNFTLLPIVTHLLTSDYPAIETRRIGLLTANSVLVFGGSFFWQSINGPIKKLIHTKSFSIFFNPPINSYLTPKQTLKPILLSVSSLD